jgi:hypothetical protein
MRPLINIRRNCYMRRVILPMRRRQRSHNIQLCAMLRVCVSCPRRTIAVSTAKLPERSSNARQPSSASTSRLTTLNTDAARREHRHNPPSERFQRGGARAHHAEIHFDSGPVDRWCGPVRPVLRVVREVVKRHYAQDGHDADAVPFKSVVSSFKGDQYRRTTSQQT